MMGVLTCVLLAAARNAEPHGPQSETLVVTLREAVAAATAAPGVSAALAAERAAGAGVRGASSLGDAALSFSTYSITARESLSASLPLPFERGARMRAARSEVVVAERGSTEALALARRELRAAWFSLAAAEARSRAVAERADRAERNLVAVEALYAEGRVPRLDRVRAAAEAALARSERGAAADAVAAAGARLGLLMGLGADVRLVVGGESVGPVVEPELSTYLERVDKQSPGLLVQQAQLSGAEARLALARRLRWPNFTVSAGANWNDPTQPGTDKWVGIGVGIPFGGGSAVAVATALRDREAALIERERRSALDAAQFTWRTARSARLRFEAVEGEVLPAAREAAELTSVAYREGRADLFRVLDAERALAEAALLRADALDAWGGAHADLWRLAGEEQP
jgi:cobalt-zinc-cadmium efflux system outer membrane protein